MKAEFKDEVKQEAKVQVKVEVTADDDSPGTQEAPGGKRRRAISSPRAKEEEVQREPCASRARRGSLAPKLKALKLNDFPYGTLVFTPRREVPGGGSYCRVIKHEQGQLQVVVPGEPHGLVSLFYLQKRSDQGLPILG